MVMFRRWLIFVGFALSIAQVWAVDDVRVSVQVDEKKIMPDSPIRATLTIQHDQNQEVKTDSVVMDGQPLQVEFVRDVEIAPDSPLRISFYQFALKPMQPGLQILSPIAVKVGDTIYKTPATTFEVPSPSRINSGAKGPVLNIEAYANAPPSIFPGQRFTVGYRFYYNDNIELKVQELPLLEAKGFKKIGSPKISDVNQGTVSIRGIEQEVEAVKAGKYPFGPSFIEGYIYRQDNFGRKQIFSKDIRAEADTVTITVSDFPEKGKPASFNGSIGEDLDFSVELLSYKDMQVGDTISLALKFSGKGDLSTIQIPKLCCEPGFPGFFEMSDIPPIPTPGNGNVVYFVELRAISPKVRAIPAIEFSYYNPVKGVYEIRRSEPIPITVQAAPEKTLPMTPGMPEKPSEGSPAEPAAQKSVKADVVNWPQTTPEAGAIEIETIYPLSVSDLTNRNFGTWSVLFVIPLGLLALFIQSDYMRRRSQKEAEVIVKTGLDYWNEAKEGGGTFSEFYALLTKALLMRLHEVKQIASEEISPQNLPEEGISGQVRAFLLEIEKERFTGKDRLSKEEIVKKADQLFKQMSQ